MWYFAEQLILKIMIIGSSPKIWRTVEVHSGLTLDDLHEVIQCVFEWTNSHLNQFHVMPDGKLTRAAWRQGKRYHTMPPDPFFDDCPPDGRSDKTLVGSVFTDEVKQIVYEYDFGDSWMHLIKLERRTPGGDQNQVPVCLAAENAAPLDDMGGIGGYYGYLAALKDEDDEMHEQAMEWLGEDFDPAEFNLDEVNKRLRSIFKPAPRKKPGKPRKKRVTPE